VVILDAMSAEANICLYLNTDVQEVEVTANDGTQRINPVTG
jgi:hypothetical protein